MQEKDRAQQSDLREIGSSRPCAAPLGPYPTDTPTPYKVHLNWIIILPSAASSPARSVKKARLVHDYVWLDPLPQREQDDVLTFTYTDIKVNKKLEREYFKLSIEQWGYSNAAIMREMIENHELGDQGVKYYLEYTNSSTVYLASMWKAVVFRSTVNIVNYNSRKSSDGEYRAHISRIFS